MRQKKKERERKRRLLIEWHEGAVNNGVCLQKLGSHARKQIVVCRDRLLHSCFGAQLKGMSIDKKQNTNYDFYPL